MEKDLSAPCELFLSSPFVGSQKHPLERTGVLLWERCFAISGGIWSAVHSVPPLCFRGFRPHGIHKGKASKALFLQSRLGSCSSIHTKGARPGSCRQTDTHTPQQGEAGPLSLAS